MGRLWRQPRPRFKIRKVSQGLSLFAVVRMNHGHPTVIFAHREMESSSTSTSWSACHAHRDWMVVVSVSHHRTMSKRQVPDTSSRSKGFVRHGLFSEASSSKAPSRANQTKNQQHDRLEIDEP